MPPADDAGQHRVDEIQQAHQAHNDAQSRSQGGEHPAEPLEFLHIVLFGFIVVLGLHLRGVVF